MSQAQHNGRGGAAAPPRDEGPDTAFDAQGIVELLRSIAVTAVDLAKGEIGLLKAEMKSSLRHVITGIGGLGVALLAGGAALNFLGLAAVGGLLAAGLPLWAAALVMAGVLVAVLIVALVVGIGALKSIDPLPHRTLRNVRRDFQVLRTSFQNGKDRSDARQ